MPNLLKCIGNHGMVCSACWSHAWDLSNLGRLLCSSQSLPLVIYTKKYNTKAKAVRAYYSHPAYLANHGQPAYYGPMNANHGHPLALEIEEKPPAGDVKIRRLFLSLGKMSHFYLWLWSLLFLFGS